MESATLVGTVSQPKLDAGKEPVAFRGGCAGSDTHDGGRGIEMKCRIYGCTGNVTADTDVFLKNGTNSFAVPKSGVLLLSAVTDVEDV